MPPYLTAPTSTTRSPKPNFRLGDRVKINDNSYCLRVSNTGLHSNFNPTLESDRGYGTLLSKNCVLPADAGYSNNRIPNDCIVGTDNGAIVFTRLQFLASP